MQCLQTANCKQAIVKLQNNSTFALQPLLLVLLLLLL
jgi:hypothetical protein